MRKMNSPCWCCKVIVKTGITQYQELTEYICDDCGEIIRRVYAAISTARQVGVPKYNPTSWRHIDPSEHMLHAIEHMRLVGLGDSSEPHLSHAICRLAMAKAILGE